jgi:tryptophan 2,3-dioxygenase
MEAFSPEETKKGIEYLYKLKEKYKDIGQDFFDYLEGLVQSKGIAYWEYIHLNSLLGLQVPQTNYKDEIIFITYHQITELYFKLIKQEIDQLTDLNEEEYTNPKMWIKRMNRCNSYMKHICDSFDVMRSGMDRNDFFKFRMALLPASGFQSVQFRHLEIMSTNLNSLLNYQTRGEEMKDEPLEILYNEIYWKSGSIDARTGEKTLTLREFEAHYDKHLIQFIKKYKYRNLHYLYFKLPKEAKENEELKAVLRDYDTYFNAYWRLSHLSSSSRHLPKAEGGTGGTNWRKYLPPKEQRILFFEPLWTTEEVDHWGEEYIKEKFRAMIEKKWMKIPKE